MENIKGMVWEEKWAIGDKLVDLQHQELLKLLNELLFACTDETMVDYIPNALNFLVQYTVTHFDDEEALQKECGFPYYEEHKKMHEDLKVTVGKLVAKYKKSGSSLELRDDLNNVLVTWLANHIEVEDHKIRDYIKKSTD